MSDKRRIGEVYWEITATNDKLEAAIVQSGGKFRRLSSDAKLSMREVAQSVVSASAQSEAALKRVDAATERSAAAASRMEGVFSRLRTAAGALGAALGVRQITQYADAWTETQNRLRLVTESQAELAKVTRQVYEVAQDARMELQPTAELYARLDKATERLGYSQSTVLRLTETISKSMRIGGGSAQANAAAIEQFNQALARGSLRGQEFNSVSTQTPRLAQAIADGLGVPIAKLREMAEAGELTTAKLTSALLTQSDVVDAEYAKLVQSIRSGFTAISNATTKWIGEAAQATGAGEKVSAVLGGVAEHMEAVAKATIGLATAGLARGFGQLVENVTSKLREQRAAAQEQQRAAIQGTFVAQAEAAAAAQVAAATERKTRKTLEDLQATRAAIIAEREVMVARLGAANAGLAQANRVPLSQLRPLGGAAVEREEQRRTMLQQQQIEAQRELARLGVQHANVNKALAATERELTTATAAKAAAGGAAAAAEATHAAAIGRTTLAARASAVAVRGLNTALGLIGGVPGLIFTAIAAGLALIARRAAAAREETEKLRGVVGSMSDTALGNTAANHQAKLAKLREEQAALEAEVRGKRLLGDDGMMTNEGVRILERRKQLTEAIAKQERVVSEVVREQNERRRQGIQVEDEKQRDDRKEVERLAGLLSAEIATNKERARAAELVKEYRAELRSLARDEGATEEKRAENQQRRIVLGERIKALTEQDQKATKAQEKNADALAAILERLSALDVRVQGGDSLAQLRHQLKELEADAEKVASGTALKSIQARLRGIEEAAVAARKADLGMEMRQLLASMTTTAVDDMRIALEQLQKQLREKGASDGQIAMITELQERAIAAKQAAEELEETLRRQRERLDRLDSSLQPKSLKDRFRVLGELEDQKRGLELSLMMARSDAERVGLQKQIEAVTERITRHTEDGRQQLDAYTGSATETHSRLQAVATEVAEITRGATAAARAFDLMGDSTASTLADVANLAEGVTKLVANPGDIGAWVQAIGSAVNLGANAFGLGKRDREEKANREENAAVVKGLREFAGALAAAVEALAQFSGQTYDAVGRAVDNIVRQSAAASGRQNILGIDPVLQAYGATFEQLKGIAAAHRIELDGTVDSYRRLSEAMQATRAAFAEFGTTLGEYQSYRALRDKAFGVTRTAGDELRELLNAGGVASNPLGQLLGGAYQSGGIQELREQLQGIVEVLAPGGASLDPTLLGKMTPEEFRAYIADLLDAVGAVEAELAPATKSAAERLQEAVRATTLALDFEDVTDAGERFRRTASAFVAANEALSGLTEGLDLATQEGIAAFDERIRQLAADVQSGALAIDGFTAEELIQALAGLETAGDAAAEAIGAAARSLAEYTRKVEDDLDVQELRNQGLDAEADLLAFRRGLEKAYAEAVEAGLSPETLARLQASNDAQLRNFIEAQAAKANPEAAAARAGSTTKVSEAQRITERTGGEISSGLNTLVALTREQNALLTRMGALGGLPVPTIQPPLLPSAYLAGWPSAAPTAQAPGAAGMGAGGVVVSQTVNFFGAVSGADEVRSAVALGGRDIAAALQRRVDEQRRVEGRAEVL